MGKCSISIGIFRHREYIQLHLHGTSPPQIGDTSYITAQQLELSAGGKPTSLWISSNTATITRNSGRISSSLLQHWLMRSAIRSSHSIDIVGRRSCMESRQKTPWYDTKVHAWSNPCIKSNSQGQNDSPEKKNYITCFTTLCTTCSIVSPLNGNWHVTSSHSTTPKLYTSTLGPYGLCSITCDANRRPDKRWDCEDIRLVRKE